MKRSLFALLLTSCSIAHAGWTDEDRALCEALGLGSCADPDAWTRRPVQGGPRIIDLCEPPGERWRLSRAGRQETRRIVRDTAKALGAEPTYFELVAERESSFRASVRHKLPGDVLGVVRSYVSNAPRYGWHIRTPKGWRGKLDGVEWSEAGKRPNETYPEAKRWVTGGLGLYGTNVPLHLARKWSPHAQPEIVCEPRVATVMAVRGARRAVKIYGAKTWLEVARVHGGRVAIKFDEGGRPYHTTIPHRAKDADFMERARRWGLNPYAKPRLGRKLGAGPTPDQIQFVENLRGTPFPKE